MIQTLQPGFENDRIEIHQKARGTAGQLQVRQHLCLMYRMQLIDCLYLDHYGAFHDQVDFQLALDVFPFVFQRYVPLAVYVKLAVSEFDDKTFLIHRLQQAGSEVPVNLYRRGDDSVRQRVQ